MANWRGQVRAGAAVKLRTRGSGHTERAGHIAGRKGPIFCRAAFVARPIFPGLCGGLRLSPALRVQGTLPVGYGPRLIHTLPGARRPEKKKEKERKKEKAILLPSEKCRN